MNLRTSGRILGLMGAFAMDGVPVFERIETLKDFWLLFQFQSVWEALKQEIASPKDPSKDPIFWDVFENLTLDKPAEAYSPNPEEEKIKLFAESIVYGILEKQTVLDEAISKASHKWKIHRMNRIDRTILRMGTYELLFVPETPKAVVLNEYVELTKVFSSEPSKPFVNGILHQISTLPSVVTVEPVE